MTLAPSRPRTPIIVAAALSTAVFGAFAIAAPVLGADGSGGITFVQALLVGFGYYLANSPWLAGNGAFFGLYRPLVAGFLVGVIMGDPVKGAEVGAAINLLYIGFISAGGSIPADPSLAGWVGTALGIASGLNAQATIALGVAIGLLGTAIFYTRMSVDAVFAHWADARAEAGDIRGVALMNVVPPQILLLVISVVPATLAVWVGADGVKQALDWLNSNAPWVVNGFIISGGLLPALGIALNMQFIFRGWMIPYFFVGYLVYVLGQSIGVNIVVVGVFGAALAFLHVHLLGERAVTERGGTR
jgi:mannose/fructose/N-acetylgalactosamine-specific phosphotransferase system component IIC